MLIQLGDPNQDLVYRREEETVDANLRSAEASVTHGDPW